MGLLGGSFLRDCYEGLTDMFKYLTLEDILNLSPKKAAVHVSNYCFAGGKIAQHKIEALREVAKIYGIPWKADNRSDIDPDRTLTKEEKHAIVEKLKALLITFTNGRIKRLEQKIEQEIKQIKQKLPLQLKKLEDLVK